MSTSMIMLIQKLRAIKESLGESELAAIRLMLEEAEEHALRIQRESPEQARRDSRHRPIGSSTR